MKSAEIRKKIAELADEVIIEQVRKDVRAAVAAEKPQISKDIQAGIKKELSKQIPTLLKKELDRIFEDGDLYDLLGAGAHNKLWSDLHKIFKEKIKVTLS